MLRSILLNIETRTIVRDQENLILSRAHARRRDEFALQFKSEPFHQLVSPIIEDVLARTQRKLLIQPTKGDIYSGKIQICVCQKISS
jgi:hypothetical protein